MKEFKEFKVTKEPFPKEGKPSFVETVYTPVPGEALRFKVGEVRVRHAKDTNLMVDRVKIEFPSPTGASLFLAVAASNKDFKKADYGVIGGRLKHIVVVEAPPSQNIHETVLELLREAKPLNPTQFGNLEGRALGRD